MNILIITAHFPSYDQPGETYATPFLFDYAEEWKKAGVDISIIHLMRVYPKAFYITANLMSRFGIQSLKKYVVSPKARNEKTYLYNGVTIQRVTFTKFIPHGTTSKLVKQRIITKLENERKWFESADIVIGDCIDPSLDVIDSFKQSINGMITNTLHNVDFQTLERLSNKSILNIVKLWLLRSRSQVNLLSKYVKTIQYEFMYSGIDGIYADKHVKYRESINKILYVGALYTSKGIDTTLEALAILKEKGYSFNFTIVGDGVDRIYFENRIKELNISDEVELLGAVPHDEVFKIMENADLFVMVSKETFGMVYVEAMSQGCIPIAAEGQGIDGVIVDQENGYLIPLGNSIKLVETIVALSKMNKEDIINLSRKAYSTAQEMTNNKLANNLLRNINQYLN